MGFIDIITKLFGNKSQKDMKAIMPYVEQVKAVYNQIDALSDDELRDKSAALMSRLQEAVADKKSRILALKSNIETIEIDQREKVYNEIDHLEKEVLDIYDKTLMNILPEAFAIVKSTARRFTENESIVVRATQMDRDLAADTRFDFVDIEGDKAIYHNS
jgi:preprotein translocase subunit SecA